MQGVIKKAMCVHVVGNQAYMTRNRIHSFDRNDTVCCWKIEFLTWLRLNIVQFKDTMCVYNVYLLISRIHNFIIIYLYSSFYHHVCIHHVCIHNFIIMYVLIILASCMHSSSQHHVCIHHFIIMYVSSFYHHVYIMYIHHHVCIHHFLSNSLFVQFYRTKRLLSTDNCH